MLDLPGLYSDAQNRVVVLVSPLSRAALAAPVPATPGWTIEMLIAHLTGVAADLVDGNVEGAATPPWTSRQIAERAGRPVSDLVAEWRQRTPQLLARLATPGQVDAAAFDLLTHEHDLRGALGLTGPSDGAAVQGVTARVTRRVSHMVAAGGLPGLRLVHEGGAWVCGAGRGSVTGPEVTGPEVTGTAPTLEWFRALFGRRSANQILTYQWEGDPTPYFGLLSLFGPLPEADVAEAGAPVAASEALP